MILREIPIEIGKLFDEYNDDISDERRLEIEGILTKLEFDFNRKADYIADCISGYGAKADFLDQEIARLKRLRDRNRKHAEHWTRYLSNALMMKTEGAPLETEYHAFSFRLSHKVQMAEDAMIPKEYTRTFQRGRLLIYARKDAISAR